MNENTITLVLTDAELNTVAAGLSELQYKFSAGVLNKISAQVKEQAEARV